MTAPTEPLKLTLEEALAHVWAAGWYMRPAVHYGNAYEWILYAREGVTVQHSFATWRIAAEKALHRPVVARDDAAELRAAAKAWAIAERAWSLAETGLDAVEAAETLTEAEVALHAALAATEGEP